MAVPNVTIKPVNRSAPSPKSRKIPKQTTKELEARLEILKNEIVELSEARRVLQEDRDYLRFKTDPDSQQFFKAVLKGIDKLDGEKEKLEKDKKAVRDELATRKGEKVH